MQEKEAAGFVPVVGNLWLAAPKNTHTQRTFVSEFFFLRLKISFKAG